MPKLRPIAITDPSVIETLLKIQRSFVQQWNQAEVNDDPSQTHDLPGGGTYSGSGPHGTASFFLPENVLVRLYVRAPWMHWHDGLSFCRQQIDSADQLRKVTLEGCPEAFARWLQGVRSAG